MTAECTFLCIKPAFSAVYGEDFFVRFFNAGVITTEANKRGLPPSATRGVHRSQPVHFARLHLRRRSPVVKVPLHHSYTLGIGKIPLGESVRKRTLVAASRGPQKQAPREGWTFPLHGPTFLFRKQSETDQGWRGTESLKAILSGRQPLAATTRVNDPSALARVRLPALF